MSSAVLSAQTLERIRSLVRDVPDFPKPGIVFKDITPALADNLAFRDIANAMASAFEGTGITHVVGIESRGFILGAPVALQLSAGFVPVRKAGKLPSRIEAQDYALEYGTDRLEIHADALGAFDGGSARVLVVDDVLATGGTAETTCKLVERLGATVVGCSFFIALGFLGGLDRMAGRRTHVLLSF